MDANQFKQLKKREDVLDLATLHATRRILTQRGLAHLADGITHVLSSDQLDKPSLHNAPQKRLSDFYRISLTAEDVAAIV